MTWTILEEGFHSGNEINNGNKFITGNGYMGYRGTLEEYTKEQLVACNIAGAVGGQKSNCLSHIYRGTQLANRYKLHGCFLNRFGQNSRHIGLDKTRRDTVGGNVLFADLACD